MRGCATRTGKSEPHYIWDASKMECAELFDTVPSFLPVLEADETIFSWGGRYHRRSGNARAEDSSRILFGDAKAGLRHDFPSHVGRLADVIGQNIAGRDLVLDHTIFGVLAKFLDVATVEEAVTMMLGQSVSGLKHRLGLLKSGAGASHPLKACRECVAIDRGAESGPIWRIEHQWPTVWVCRRHEGPLAWIDTEGRTKDRKRWLLPDGVSRDEWIDLPSVADGQLAHLHRIATLTSKIAMANEVSFDSTHLRLTYLLGANDLGFVVTSDGSVRFKETLTAVRAWSSDLVTLPGWGFLMQAENPHGGFVGLLLRQYRGNHHISKHLALIDFLFGTFENFIAMYQTVTAAADAGTLEELRATLRSTRIRVLSSVKADGLSINQAATNAGVQPAQAVEWVKDAGIPYKARPRVLNAERKGNLLRMLRAGRSRDDIAARIGVKKSWLRAFLADNNELRERWLAKVEASRRDSYRKNFLRLVATHVGVPTKRIKAIPGNGFSWLYNHDRAWLMANLPQIKAAA